MAKSAAPTLADLNAKQKQLENIIKSMNTQIMQAQLFLEERIRSDGASGIKAVRLYHEGTSAFFEDNHIGNGALSMHDHANYDRTVGLGEFIAVMNGVEFRTRHNDYKLRMPLKRGKYLDTEYIPFPPVPPSVLKQGSVPKQVAEMQEYFRAFRDQNVTHRDYRNYFKANLCVAEGSWTLNTNTLSEPFQSDRHHIDATSWQDLQDKVRFTSYTGTKSRLENFSWLPTKFYGQENGVPKVAQWTYRIICNPIRYVIKAKHPDLVLPATRRPGSPAEPLADRRSDQEIKSRQVQAQRVRHGEYRFLHRLFHRVSYAIPLEIVYMTPLLSWNPYHVAYTDITPSPQAAAVTANGRYGGFDKRTAFNGTNKSVFYRVSGVPSVYIQFYYSTESEGPRVKNRVKLIPNLAVHHVSFLSPVFSRTPEEFYATGKVEADKADTARGSVGVLDKQGNVHRVAGSGVRVITPSIGGNVGQVRTRYPIFPVHAEGSSTGIELSVRIFCLKTEHVQVK
ncbi:uncharacterized protein LOC101861940 [Aplysia californica]|uniref:Uncharacterized protein LOC101861940 n=1 Tax=Aplysia californica TaxID=6500 RepID=A0ABM1VPB2_APLCA|nr:uncharacterized protein LOC101861940 [Aplysia californica]